MTNSNQTPSVSNFGPGIGGVIVVAIILLVALMVYGQSQKPSSQETCPVPPAASSSQREGDDNVRDTSQPAAKEEAPTQVDQGNETVANNPPPEGALPRLVDLGTTNCQPCKMMIPVMEELRQKYRGKLQVDFINLSIDNAAAQRYNVRVIPLQIFFDASGKELFRHAGYWPTADIVNEWKQLGFNLE